MTRQAQDACRGSRPQCPCCLPPPVSTGPASSCSGPVPLFQLVVAKRSVDVPALALFTNEKLEAGSGFRFGVRAVCAATLAAAHDTAAASAIRQVKLRPILLMSATLPGLLAVVLGRGATLSLQP